MVPVRPSPAPITRRGIRPLSGLDALVGERRVVRHAAATGKDLLHRSLSPLAKPAESRVGDAVRDDVRRDVRSIANPAAKSIRRWPAALGTNHWHNSPLPLRWRTG